MLGGLLYGPLIYRYAREARGHGVPEVMIAVADSGGRIRPQVSVVKALASALCIGVGGSVGREGPIVQIGSALASSIGQRVKVPEDRLRILVACGAAGGIAATFNAPITGVFFGVEIILREFSVDALVTVMLSAMVADVTAIPFVGSQPFLSGFPAGLVLHHPRNYLLVSVLAVVAALLGLAFKSVLYKIEDLCDRVWQGRPEWARPAVGGIALGLLLLALPQLYGVGYPVMDRATAGGYGLWFLILLAFGKIIATSLSIGIGGSGGVFAPSLFIGVTSGMAYGDIVNHLFGASAGQPALYAVIAMGAVFTSAARAPLTSLASVVEMTGDFSLTLPVMLAVAIASATSRMLSYGTIYTTKLLRRGIDLDRMTPLPAPADLKVADSKVTDLKVASVDGTFMPGLRLAGEFYAAAVRPLLEAEFPALRYAAALLGPGSEVLGLDTVRSTDHDWGPRLLVFIPNGAAQHTHAIMRALDQRLPGSFRGYPVAFGVTREPDGVARQRVQVVELGAWLTEQLGFDPRAGVTVPDWLAVPTQRLAGVTAGAVFHDEPGELSQVRTRLEWYPGDVWRYVLSCQWVRIGQEEAFPGRCAEVGDELGSAVVTARLVRDLMRLWLLMHRRYPPYSKWLGTAFARVPGTGTAPLGAALTAALAATDWPHWERHLVEAYGLVAEAHNALGLTEAVDPSPRRYYDRPFWVLDAGRFAAALTETIADPVLRGRPPIGAADQFMDSTDVLGDLRYPRAVVSLAGSGLDDHGADDLVMRPLPDRDVLAL